MSEKVDFDLLVNRALQNAELATMRPVVEKELLHYDVLFCLDKAGLLDGLVFQGGTSLRLCYNSNRFSEDLDFAGGKTFCSAQLMAMKSCIEEYIGARYGFAIRVKAPEELRLLPDYDQINVDRWQITIETSPQQSNIARQRIKIEIANIEAYTRNTLPLGRNYFVLPDGYNETLIYVETLEEVMADKLVAFPATQTHIRYRDMWDLVWLYQQGARINRSLLLNKIADYRVENYADKTREKLKSLEEIMRNGVFHNEMKRFIPADIFERTLKSEKFNGYFLTTLSSILKEALSNLEVRNEQDKDAFLM
ncbi:nucleotidyl transferase AbiEii/AbiGii toxin family protein [Rahnella woolbedingensis]|uniref:Nucleotidyl transferase AbiEii/AbiGii toxin family protein n=1 Tax=Rahnella woolbedingensis TaxID=1510574 RepID=A0A419N453_9GAMM|nr:nucleotidyl transferase AbiEii/AbiGii toxin family protein [Rahnella woolbedingensis]RJT39438.1 nucleotidyl transferase AbiEii/AbiGii toxin family protein [Rahnella woolbedingensis]